MSIADDLAAHLAGDDTLPPDDLDGAPPLTVADEQHANRTLRQLGRLAATEADLRAAYAAERERLDAFLEDRLAGVGRQRAWLDRGLDGWMRAVHAADPTRKTVKLAAGEVRIRPAPHRIDVSDPVAAAAALPDAVVDKPPVLDKAAVKRAVAAGPLSSWKVSPDPGYEIHEAVDGDGSPVPGVWVLVAREPNVTWTAR